MMHEHLSQLISGLQSRLEYNIKDFLLGSHQKQLPGLHMLHTHTHICPQTHMYTANTHTHTHTHTHVHVHYTHACMLTLYLVLHVKFNFTGVQKFHNMKVSVTRRPIQWGVPMLNKRNFMLPLNL